MIDLVAVAITFCVLIFIILFGGMYQATHIRRLKLHAAMWEARYNVVYTSLNNLAAPGNNLRVIRATNLQRSLHWHPNGPQSWRLSQWSNAAAGEMGELCNVIKKMERVMEGLNWSNSIPIEQLTHMAKLEIGDVILYLDLLAASLTLNLSDCIRDTFNRVSVRENKPERL